MTRQAEGEGFEPPVRTSPTMVFKTIALNHSAIPPRSAGPSHLTHQATAFYHAGQRVSTKMGDAKSQLSNPKAGKSHSTIENFSANGLCDILDPIWEATYDGQC